MQVTRMYAHQGQKYYGLVQRWETMGHALPVFINQVSLEHKANTCLYTAIALIVQDIAEMHGCNRNGKA